MRSLHVLLVDDSAEFLESVRRLLGQHTELRIVGHATSGCAALEQVAAINPDLVLMDLSMPGMTGLEATRRIRADAGQATTPIVALTALAMPGDRERCIAAGATDYVSKPVSLKGLLTTIETYVG
jgi:CheY-like chemotaxis protein